MIKSTETESTYSDYVTVKEACELLQVSRTALDNYVKDGRVTRFEQGAPRKVLYSRSELNRLKRIKPKGQ